MTAAGRLPTQKHPPARSVATDPGVLRKLAEGINGLHLGVEHNLHSALDGAIQAGQLLLTAKAGLHHGEWHRWLKTNIKFSERMARNYMRLARNQDRLGAKRQLVAEMTIKEAIHTISNETQRIARLPAPIIDKAFNETGDEANLKGVLRRAESHHRFQEFLRREQEQAGVDKTWVVVGELPPPFEETITVEERAFITDIEAAIATLVRAAPGTSPRRIADLFNEAGGQALGERWDQ